ncbi:hypothetical protein ASA1KI_21500 [Opitutales bacterium ASA1]|nr:hypothetical protein ASA1KI_21500 [Opitutales bacterium ASA1]
MERKSGKGFSIACKPIAVHDLIVEDWSPGSGLLVNRDGLQVRYKESVQPGAVFAVDNNGRFAVAVSEDVSRAVNKLISELGTKRLLETYQRRPEGDVYEENLRRIAGSEAPPPGSCNL